MGWRENFKKRKERNENGLAISIFWTAVITCVFYFGFSIVSGQPGGAGIGGFIGLLVGWAVGWYAGFGKSWLSMILRDPAYWVFAAVDVLTRR